MIKVRSGGTIAIGVGTTIGGLAAAAALSAATAPAAHADDFTDILSDVQADLAAGQTELTAAETAFGGGISGVPAGISDLAYVVYDDDYLPGWEVLVGTGAALQNISVPDYPTAPGGITFPEPYTFADALTAEQTLFPAGETYLTDTVAALSAGHWEVAATDFVNAEWSFIQEPALLFSVGGVESLFGF
jgi:hypothetical protein